MHLDQRRITKEGAMCLSAPCSRFNTRKKEKKEKAHDVNQAGEYPWRGE